MNNQLEELINIIDPDIILCVICKQWKNKEYFNHMTGSTSMCKDCFYINSDPANRNSVTATICFRPKPVEFIEVHLIV
jgi:hypothetical protein